MVKEIFKKEFGEICKAFEFNRGFGAWYKESAECIFVLELQKSNYSDLYYVNIKVFIQGMFNKNYVIDKALVKSLGNVFLRVPGKYHDLLNLELLMPDDQRLLKLKEMFVEFIVPFCEKGLSKIGMKELAKDDTVFLQPAVKEQLDLLIQLDNAVN